jgi:polyisoprenoid-binding protein YceI
MNKRLAYSLIGLIALSGFSPARAASWTVDPDKSALTFSGTQTGAAFTGHFDRFQSEIQFDPAHLETSHVKITIEMGSAKTGDMQRDGAMPGKDWFDIVQFPLAIFETKAIHKTDATHYVADGTLTIRGVAKPVTLPFNLIIADQVATMHGDAKIARSVFGVGQGPWATGDWVGLDVGIDVSLVAHAVK